jgi:hypothetical protein
VETLLNNVCLGNLFKEAAFFRQGNFPSHLKSTRKKQTPGQKRAYRSRGGHGGRSSPAGMIQESFFIRFLRL